MTIMTFDHVKGLTINLTDTPFQNVLHSVIEKPEIYAYQIFDTLTANHVPPEVAISTAISYSKQTQKAIRPTAAFNTPHLHLDNRHIIH